MREIERESDIYIAGALYAFHYNQENDGPCGKQAQHDPPFQTATFVHRRRCFQCCVIPKVCRR